jgi:peptidyl-prolyl cis-trans isomerase SurA
MNIKIILYFFVILSILTSKSLANDNTLIIKLTINDQIITNYDLEKEKNYLFALNPKLQNIEKSRLLQLSRDSLIREKIKQKEIEKFYEIDYENEQINRIIESIFLSLNIPTVDEFKIYLQKFDITIPEIKKKISIEQVWNKLIFDLYNDKLLINEDVINKQLDEIFKNNLNKKSFNLSEIVFTSKNKTEFNNTLAEIKNVINNNGFEEAAKIFSISNTAKSGGSLGWINENQLNEKIYSAIINLNANQYSDPIITAGSNIILMVNEIKDMDIADINRKDEFQKIINQEKNRQLNEFSIIHFKKLESNAIINEK